MSIDNSYQSPANQNTSSQLPKRRRSVVKRLMVGFALGASMPTIVGVYGIYQFNASVAYLPPDRPVGGNDLLVSIALIIFVAPRRHSVRKFRGI